MTHCNKQKRPHADVFRGRACTTDLHILHFLNSCIRARENDLDTRRGTRHSNSVTKTITQQIETEFRRALSTTIFCILGTEDRTPNTCSTTADQINANHPRLGHLVSDSINTSTKTLQRITPTRTHSSYIEKFQIMNMRVSDLHPNRQETKRAINVRMFI